MGIKQPLAAHLEAPKGIPSGPIEHCVDEVDRSLSLPVVATENENLDQYVRLSSIRKILIASTLTGVVLSTSVGIGLVVVAIPSIAADLSLPENLMLWPASAYSLTCGCCLLLAGSIADLVGNRMINLVGTLILGVFFAAAGAATNGTQFIVFRALQGIGAAMIFPTTISILTTTFRPGQFRNVCLALMNVGQAIGWQLGLTLSGVFSQTSLHWRFAFFLWAGLTAVFFAVSLFVLPQSQSDRTLTWRDFVFGIDWVGLLISTGSLGCLNYVLAIISSSLSSIREPVTITLLVVSCVLASAFVPWMSFQEKRGKPALIPNSIWRETAFSCMCVIVLLCWAVILCFDMFSSLFYQRVQFVSPLMASLRFLPNSVFALVTNIGTGFIVHRIPANVLIITSISISAVAPLLMAVIDPAWSWWRGIFWANLTSPICVDVLYTLANLIITNTLPKDRQALAGSIFEINVQFGTSLGFAIMAVISQSVTNETSDLDKTSAHALLTGYRAAFWTMFGMLLAAALIGAIGFRKMRRVGV